jgi:chemotaxis protein CheX
LQEATLDVKLINPFLEAAVNVLKTMAMMDAKPKAPYLKKERTAIGDVTGIIGITGQSEGSLSISFQKDCIFTIVANLFGSPPTSLNDEVRDAVGELTNMICGDARRRLEAQGIVLQAGTPTVVSGENHVIAHIVKGPVIAVPFTTVKGEFVVEIGLSK